MSQQRTRKKVLMRLFPNLNAGCFRIASRPTSQYNCIAWATGNNDRWWEPTARSYWPPGVVRAGTTVPFLVTAYEALGFLVCQNPDLETGFDKVAIYANATGYTHAARQLQDGRWASKLGELEDIEHDTLDDLAGSDYGAVVTFMMRPRRCEALEGGQNA